MKTSNDFKVVNGIATLVDVAYAEEAKVVDEYLKASTQIEQVSVRAKDGRSFELKDGRLVLSNGQTFLNPYYVKQDKEVKYVREQDEKVDRLNLLLKELSGLLNSYFEDRK